MAPSDELALLRGRRAATDDAAGELTGRILDAALEEFGAYGLRRANIDAIARRAGLARVTVYRRFAGKQELIRAVALREAHRAMVAVARAADGQPTLEGELVEGFVTGIRLARSHPLLTRLLDSEPETILPLLTTDSTFVLTFLRDFLAEEIRRAPGSTAGPDPAATAEVMVRLAMSFVLAPHSCIANGTDDDLRALARSYLLPLLARRP